MTYVEETIEGKLTVEPTWIEIKRRGPKRKLHYKQLDDSDSY